MADNRLKATDIIGANGSEALLEVYGYTSAAAIAGIVGNISRGTASSKTIVSSGDAFRITATGYDGTAQRDMAEISMAVGATPGSGDMPGSIVFKVTPDGSTTLGTALTIAQSKAITAASTFTATGGIISTAIGATGASTGAFTTGGFSGTQTNGGNIASTAAAFILQGQGATSVEVQHSNAGAALVRFSPLATNNTSNATVDFMRSTNTVGTRQSVWYVGDGTATAPPMVLNHGTGALTITGAFTAGGDVAVNGGDITTSQTTFNLVNATATTVNFAQAATTLTMGATTGTCTIRNATLTVTGNLGLQGALNVMGDASTDLITFVGRCVLRSVTDAGPMTATPGTQAEVVFNTSDSKFYGCTVTHGTAATWVALN